MFAEAKTTIDLLRDAAYAVHIDTDTTDDTPYYNLRITWPPFVLKTN